MAEASAVNYRMFVVFEVWPTGIAQPLYTHRVLGYLWSSILIFSNHSETFQTLLKLIDVIMSEKSEENELTDM